MTLLHSCNGSSLVTSADQKSGAAETAIQMVHGVENLFHSRMRRLRTINRSMVKWVHSDREAEDMGFDSHKWLNKLGVVHESTTAHSP